ncbi:RNA-binding domain-containing protein [Candidatus Nitrotoga arctica]|uniref:AAA family ATPase n=1 Tax=Candidatus Nitrotoga arctica TaxID=453162 RepID=A0ABM8YWL0_9PROT|nr:RNA-binding domain-containing protein [Candidatus Nitrotoga arctica]CAG9931895.1 AAA family ATPase [Candidatus Nitrotoga arctica]
MNEKLNSLDLPGLAEAYDLECKAAQGRDGRGELPEDFWKSYSAMANADGGIILLGVQEKPQGSFQALGLAEIERVRKALWDNLHNRKQVSVNLLDEEDIQSVEIDGKTVLRIQVPRASRQSKPVYIGSNPLGGTYLRRYEGDYLADDETVRRMLAERVEDSRDERILKGFDFSDLDMETVAAYRNRFAAVKPGHVWADLPVTEFLEKIGAYGKNREEGYSGIRLAGLLMFGRAEVIRDALPRYMVDYQERPEAKAEKRWVDRLVPDGGWSGNIYDFFRKVYQKLTSDLKVPFQLQNGQRVEDTPVHEALREALVNTLIHADFTGRVSVLVVKRPDMFGFRNPGLMRISPELAIHGGNSDCRNRRLQTMFQLVGYGDHAGSGIPKIYNNWANRHWRRPVLYEVRDPEQTLMELRMSSLVPEEAIAELEAYLGEKFHALSEPERLALITASTEGVVSHARLREICIEHPADLSKILAHLVRDNLLASDGTGRGMVYFLPWQKQREDALFDLRMGVAGIAGSRTIPPELGSVPPELNTIPPELGAIPPELPPQYLEWNDLPPELQSELLALAEPIRAKPRVPPELLKQTILALCDRRYLGRRVLACLLERNADDLLKRTLTPMVAAKLLIPAFASSSNPKQAYMAVSSSSKQAM